LKIGIGEGGTPGGELTGSHSLGGVGIRGEGEEVFIPHSAPLTVTIGYYGSKFRKKE